MDRRFLDWTETTRMSSVVSWKRNSRRSHFDETVKGIHAEGKARK